MLEFCFSLFMPWGRFSCHWTNGWEKWGSGIRGGAMLNSRHLLESSSLLGVFPSRLLLTYPSSEGLFFTTPSPLKKKITMCKIDSQWEFAVWLRKLKQGLCSNLEGWGGGGSWERVSKGRGHGYTYGWFMLTFGRKQQNSVKQLSSNKN